MSGLATREVPQRQFEVFGEARFERLATISNGHVYNLRGSATYRAKRTAWTKTRATTVTIGLRQAPEPEGRPGHVRVDTVHQGDRDGVKGLYVINLDEFESIYQTTFHKGIQDLIVHGEIVHQFFLVEDAPFREARIGGLRHGAEVTLDHSSFKQLLTPPEGESDFARLPCGNFREFLVKADVAYYGRRNMRWAHYSARDHGRPHVVVGTRFFARLVQGLLGMADEQWMWDDQFARRWHERRHVIVRDVVRTHLQQSFAGEPELPDLTPIDEMMESFRSMRSSRTADSDSRHGKWQFNRAAQSTDGESQ